MIVDESYATPVELDIEGNQRAVIDALDRVVMRYDYDMLGTVLHSDSMEAGSRWILNNVAGKPIYAWDSRDHRLRTTYDELGRPTAIDPSSGSSSEIVSGKTLYGEQHSNPESANLRGKLHQTFDGAGVVTNEDYDFKGNITTSKRQLAGEYKTTSDWAATVALEPEVFTTQTTLDALNRPVQLVAPDNSVIRPSYNEASLLERVEPTWVVRQPARAL